MAGILRGALTRLVIDERFREAGAKGSQLPEDRSALRHSSCTLALLWLRSGFDGHAAAVRGGLPLVFTITTEIDHSTSQGAEEYRA